MCSKWEKRVHVEVAKIGLVFNVILHVPELVTRPDRPKKAAACEMNRTTARNRADRAMVESNKWLRAWVRNKEVNGGSI